MMMKESTNLTRKEHLNVQHTYVVAEIRCCKVLLLLANWRPIEKYLLKFQILFLIIIIMAFWGF
jgi:hypothetical protein